MGPLSRGGAGRPTPPAKSGRGLELPSSLSSASRSVLPPAGEPHAPPSASSTGHASQLPLGSRSGAAKLGRPRLARGPRAHTKLGRPPRLASAHRSRERRGEGRKAGGGERAWESARPQPGTPRRRPVRAQAPPVPQRAPSGAPRPGRARPPPAPALAGNNAALLPRSRRAQPTRRHPRRGRPAVRARRASGPSGRPKPPERARAGERRPDRGGDAAREERLLPGPRQPRPPDSYYPAPR